MEQNISNIKSRILYHIDMQGVSKRSFYQKTGIANGLLDKASGVSEDTIEKYISAFPEISTDWLLTGKGEMFKNTAPSNTSLATSTPGNYLDKRRSLKQSSTNQFIEMKNDTGEMIPIFDVPVDASFIEHYNDEKYFSPIGYLNMPKLRHCNFAAVISGNSMYPLMKSGSIVVCRIIEDFDYFDNGEMYFVSTTNGFDTVKWVQDGDSPDELLLIPENSKIKPKTIKKSMVIKMCIVEAWLNFR